MDELEKCEHVILVESLFYFEGAIIGPCIKCKQIVDSEDAEVYDDGKP